MITPILIVYWGFQMMYSSFLGMAVKQTTDGECEERIYVDGKLEGQATVIFPDSGKEMRNYQNNKPNGQAMLFAPNGDRIEFNYENGVISGKANIKGSNGDKESCIFVKGVKHGPATYFWKAGHRYVKNNSLAKVGCFSELNSELNF